ncbi:MAG: hypothetical protein VX899_19220 [Myxococcota bacterium]|nr:hypothetical protein [Myxococcota bacterium]
MPASALPPAFTLKIADAELDKELMEHMIRIEMSESVSALDAITIEFSVPMTADRYTLIKASEKWIGAEYCFECVSGGVKSKQYKGMLMGMTHDFGRDATWKITLTGVDQLAKLRRGRVPNEANWQSLKDAISTMASEVGLSAGDILEYQPTDKELQQNEKEDLAFLSEFAKKVGFAVRELDGKLHFMPTVADHAAKSSASVSWKKDVVSMNLTADISGVYSKVMTVAYDSKAVEDIKAEADKGALKAYSGGKTGAEFVSSAWKTDRMMFLPAQVDRSSSELKQEAEGKLKESNMSFIKGKVTLYGRPDIHAGSKVTVKDGHWPLSGDFFVNQVNHSIAPGAGFKTTLDIVSDSLPTGP